MVWISGGGYLECNSANPRFTGAALAAAGAVVVSAHYRSGFEGLARVAGASDNRALLDQLAALRWVHENIGGFGGDPVDITVLGQSAGAHSIAALLLMPAQLAPFAARLCRASRRPTSPPTFADAITAEISSELGRSPTVTDQSRALWSNQRFAPWSVKASRRVSR